MSEPQQIVQVLGKWLDGGYGLENAIRKTAGQGLFPEGDIRFAVEHLRKSVTPEKLEQWKFRAAQSSRTSIGTSDKSDAEHCEKPGIQPDSEQKEKPDTKTGTEKKEKPNARTDTEHVSGPDTKPDAPKKDILCLHAGNLPLVGLQDVIAVILSGNRYFGKISRKDPWLIPSFLDVCRKEIPDQIGGYDTEIAGFRNLNADAVIFTGSEKSVKPVRSELESLGAVHPGTRYLIRTAQLSLAYIELKDSFRDLAEAVLRYSGRGCRSVGVVVSPMDLEEYRRQYSAESITEYSDETAIPDNGLNYSIAYARAVGLPVFQLADQFFIQTSDINMIRPGVVLWVKGSGETLDEMRARLGSRLQTVYSDTKRLVDGSNESVVSPAAQPPHTFEPLDKAQKPDIDWMPDGVDTLEWLWRELSP